MNELFLPILSATIFVIVGVVAFALLHFYHLKKLKNLKRFFGETLNNLTENNSIFENDNNVNDSDLKDIYKQLKNFQRQNQQTLDLRNEVSKLIDTYIMHQDVYHIFECIMPKIFSITGSICGAFYLVNPAEHKLEIKYSLGFNKDIYNEFDISIGDGYVGVAALTGKIQILKNIPENKLYKLTMIQGFLTPKEIIAIPISYDNEVKGVLIIATTSGYAQKREDVIELISYYVGIAVASGLYHEQNMRLNNELSFQNTLIQDLNNELERKIRGSKLAFKSVVDNISDYGIYSLDTLGVILTFNKEAEAIFGRRESEVVGRHVSILQGKDSFRHDSVDEMLEIARDEDVYEVEGFKYKKNGSMYYARTSIFAMDNEDGELVGYACLIKDISINRNVNHALGFNDEFVQNLFNSSTEALLTTDVKGKIKIFNKKTEEMLEEDELEGVRIYELFTESYHLQKNLEDVATRFGTGSWLSKRRADNESIWFEVNAVSDVVNKDATLFIRLHR